MAELTHRQEALVSARVRNKPIISALMRHRFKGAMSTLLAAAKNQKDLVRLEEHRKLHALGDDRLKQTRNLWLKDPENLSTKQRVRFQDLQGSTLKTARACAIKEMAMSIWESPSLKEAEHDWRGRYSWEIRSRIAPSRKPPEPFSTTFGGILKRHERRLEHQDLIHQAGSTRIQKPGTFPQRYLLSLRWTRSLPGNRMTHTKP